MFVEEVASKQATQSNVLREQKLQACEIALTEGIEKNSETVLRWFTSEILHFPWAWSPVVAMAILDRTKAGEYRWRTARNPLGMIRIIAERAALKWNPELLFGNDAEKVLRPMEQAVSTLRPASENSNTANYASYEDEVIGGGSWHDEFIDRAAYAALDDYDGPEVWEELDYLLTNRGNDGSGLDWNWDEIARRIGFTDEQAAIMKARAQGITRAEMGKHLLWDEQRVERVWRSVSRLLEKPDIAKKARATLCRDY
jgi:hypothetical protein